MVNKYFMAVNGALLETQTESAVVELSSAQLAEAEAVYAVGELENTLYSVVVLNEIGSQLYSPLNLRKLLGEATSEAEYIIFSRASQISVWHDQHRFCGRCGGVMEHHSVDLAKHCAACGLVQYPRISPCIIVLVTDGDRCLLARSPHFPPGRFSTLAGFIEAGETAEAAVHREIMEEVGIQVENVRYHQSQSWPFPHALMLGYFAEYAGGELAPDGVEIEEAHWYHRDHMPDLPPSFAISYALIEHFMLGKV
ncbi:NAD(+) diphosphatase [Neptunomonas phycophila]|uniref:NAD(+) diphosphatase n=1 Tax=Neptunomonas phycophila TaxID=1572645 RepID=UPI003736AAE8